MPKTMRWMPTIVLLGGCALILSLGSQRDVPLREPLTALPTTLADMQSLDRPLDTASLRVAAPSSYLYRVFYQVRPTGDSVVRASLYVGYYESQSQGKSIHSPKNCLPGAGWESLSQSRKRIQAPGGTIEVNRYLVAKDSLTSLVYYWYQGRGRTEANEYVVKFNLMRDRAFQRRSDEALVRIVVPVHHDAAAAEATAEAAVRAFLPRLRDLLPA